MTETKTTPQQPGFFARLPRLIARIILILVLGILLGVFLFYGVNALYHHFVQPVQEHTLQILDLQAGQDRIGTQTGEGMATLSARLESVELESANNKNSLAQLNTLQMMQATSEANLAALQTSAANHQSSLVTQEASLQKIQDNTKSGIEALNLNLTRLGQRIADLESAQSNNVSLSEMRQQLQLLQTMQLILRAEFYLAQSNYGLAVQDIQTAGDVLRDLSSSLPPEKVAPANEVIGYLDSALADLPDHPVVANDKISTAWQILLVYLQKPTATPTVTPTASPTLEPTATNTPVPSSTPTATATP
jgi:hypothetical protein